MSNAKIIPLSNSDPAMVEELIDRAFEPERKRRTAYKVREGMEYLPALSFATLDDNDMLVGTIQCWPVGLSDPKERAFPMIMVGPVAVLPEEQHRGFGQALMAATLQAIEPAAPLPLVMIGDPEYYGRFWGFTCEYTADWTLPGPWDPERLLVRCDNPAILPRAGALGPWRS